jgi:hypothetical protein
MVLTSDISFHEVAKRLTEKVLSPQKVRNLGLKRRFKIELNQDDPTSASRRNLSTCRVS